MRKAVKRERERERERERREREIDKTISTTKIG